VNFDLNCDLGEGEPRQRTRALMRYVTSVNIACGGHAGDVVSMDYCVRWARKLGVRPGAHPGVAGNFGRDEPDLGPRELGLLVLQQVGALRRLAEVQRVRLHHIKLHGGLYHLVERQPGLARAYVAAVKRWFPGLRIYALAGGRVAALGRKVGVTVWEEAFADRAYRTDGTLVPRAEPGAVLHQPSTVRARLRELRAGRAILATDGSRLALRPRTICVHGDTPGAVAFARVAAQELQGERGLSPGRTPPPKSKI
jgi:UPF0271 protein